MASAAVRKDQRLTKHGAEEAQPLIYFLFISCTQNKLKDPKENMIKFLFQ